MSSNSPIDNNNRFTIRQLEGPQLDPKLREWIAENAVWPFQNPAYLELFSKFGERMKSSLHVFAYLDGKPATYFPFDRADTHTLILMGMRQILGNQDLSDYGDAVYAPEVRSNPKLQQQVWKALLEHSRKSEVDTINLDFVREDSPAFMILNTSGTFLQDIHILSIKQELALRADISGTWENYLARINKKDRQELNRKLRRLETVPYNFEFTEKASEQDIVDFVNLHRLSQPAKEKFMSKRMEGFFRELIRLPLRHWHFAIAKLAIKGKPAASVLYLSDGKSLLAYNSGFDPAFNYFSAGLLIHALVIKDAQYEGFFILDFLRGNERYKSDLGAMPGQLWQLKINYLKPTCHEQKQLAEKESDKLPGPGDLRSPG